MNRIRELRESRGLNQTRLAQELSVSQGTLSYWERGYVEPDNKSIIKLANFFNVTTDYLLGVTNIPSPSGIEINETLKKIKSLSPEDQAKAEEYIDMLKTLREVQSGENIVDFAKKA